MWRLHAPPSREADINPNPQKGGYPAPDRVTFLTGANRDFPKRRRHVLPGILCPSVLDGSPETQLSYRLGDLGRIFLVGISSTERTDDHYFPEQRLSLTAASVSLLATSRGTQPASHGELHCHARLGGRIKRLQRVRCDGLGQNLKLRIYSRLVRTDAQISA